MHSILDRTIFKSFINAMPRSITETYISLNYIYVVIY